MASNGGSEFAQLRRWTVAVLLGLLILLTLADIGSSYLFGKRFPTDPAFYSLCGGMIAGLFIAEGVAAYRRTRKDE